jgi:predicted transcriptional regulator
MEQVGSIFDDVDEARKARAIAEARADVAAGRVVPHEVVAEWLLKLADAFEKGEPPPPAPRSGIPR